jgi:hypothetical protein
MTHSTECMGRPECLKSPSDHLDRKTVNNQKTTVALSADAFCFITINFIFYRSAYFIASQEIPLSIKPFCDKKILSP